VVKSVQNSLFKLFLTLLTHFTGPNLGLQKIEQPGVVKSYRQKN
jgi:hypothetical protein